MKSISFNIIKETAEADPVLGAQPFLDVIALRQYEIFFDVLGLECGHKFFRYFN